MIAGAALVLISGLTAASIFGSLSQTVEVLVANRSIPEGATITNDDIKIVPIAAESGAIEVLAPSQVPELVGRIAAGPIGSGSILHPAQFINTKADASEATVVIGAALGPNDIPRLRLLPGDRVRLFEVGRSTLGDNGSTAVATRLGDAVVVEATPLGAGSNLHVSFRINESISNVVANRIAQGRLSIALIDSLPSTDSIVPLQPAQPLEPSELEADG